ncbi:protein stoned-A-like isoform X2 [Artemia franciscana]|uniref:protein stoned-A-like isoform X2 n=1 Tax=Artemia franciscana TaxID=6661 RepID=UPI0032D9AF33
MDQEPREESEEWRSFFKLTASVDTAISKTQGDLDRFKTAKALKQENEASSPDKSWIGFDRGFDEDEEIRQTEEEREKIQDSSVAEFEDPFIVQEDLDQEEVENQSEEGDIFDTGFIEAVTNVDLVYIPDSPTYLNGEPDPFDTANVEKIIGKLPVESERKKKQKLITLGNAAEVLAGISSKPKELILQNRKEDIILLGESVISNGTFTSPLSLLDISPTVSLPRSLHQSPTEAEVESKIKEDNFDLDSQGDNDEFADLAYESLHRKVEVSTKDIDGLLPVEEIFKVLEEIDDPFNTSPAEELLRKVELDSNCSIRTDKLPPLRPPPISSSKTPSLFDIFSPTRPRGESFEQFSCPGSKKVSSSGDIYSEIKRKEINSDHTNRIFPVCSIAVENKGDSDPFDTSSVNLGTIDSLEDSSVICKVEEGEILDSDFRICEEQEVKIEERDPFDTTGL